MHYRVVVTTADGTAAGDDGTFKTGAPGSSGGGGAGSTSTGNDKTAPKLTKVSFALKSTKRKGKKKVIRYAAKGALHRSLKAGAQTVPFSGRIGHRALKRGAYRVTIVAIDSAKNRSKAAKLTFTIVRP